MDVNLIVAFENIFQLTDKIIKMSLLFSTKLCFVQNYSNKNFK